jgi:hypothetical protein
MGAGAMPSATAVARARASAADVGASERRSASGAGSRISAGVWRPAEHGQYVQDEAQGGISEASENTVAPGGGGGAWLGRTASEEGLLPGRERVELLKVRVKHRYPSDRS